MLFKSFAITAATAIAIGLAGCATSTNANDQVLKNYFTAIAAVQPNETLVAADYAVDGSIANAYAQEQAANKQAMLDGGTLDTAGQTVLFENEKAYICVDGYDTPGAKRDDFCFEYSNFEFENGKLSTFDSGGKPMAGRIALGNGTSTPIGEIGTITYLSSYVTINGNLVVNLEVKSRTTQLQIPYDATFVNSSGRQVEVSSFDGPNELKQDRVGNVAYAFAGAEIGGNLELVFMDADWNEIPISIPAS